jgi:hypothetical protein
VIAIECKGTFVKSADKYSGVPSRFFRGLTQKFGRARGGGVYQLVRGISRVWVQRNARPPFERPERVTDVFPVLVGQDPILECGPVARVLSDRFQRAMAVALRGATPPTPKVWPLTVVSANELDALAANIERAHPRLDSVLKRFHRQHPSRVFSLGDYLTSGDAREFGFPLAGRETLRQRFKKATEAALARVANGAHGGGETP